MYSFWVDYSSSTLFLLVYGCFLLLTFYISILNKKIQNFLIKK